MSEISQKVESHNNLRRITATHRNDQIIETRASNISLSPTKRISELNYNGGLDKNKIQSETHYIQKKYQDASRQQKYTNKQGTRSSTIERNIHEIHSNDFPSADNKKIWNIKSIKEINEVIPIESQREEELKAVKEIDDYLESHTSKTVNGYADTEYEGYIDESPIVGGLAKDKSQNNPHSKVNGFSIKEDEKQLNSDNRSVQLDNIEKIWNINSIQEINESEKELERQSFRKVDEYLESQITKKVNEREHAEYNGTISESPVVKVQAKPRSKGTSNLKISNVSIKESEEQSNPDSRSAQLNESEKVWNIRTIHQVDEAIPTVSQRELELGAIRKANSNMELNMTKKVNGYESTEYNESLREVPPAKVQAKPRSKHYSNLEISSSSTNESKLQTNQSTNLVQSNENEKVWNIKSIHEINEVYATESQREPELENIKTSEDYLDSQISHKMNGHLGTESWQLNEPHINVIPSKEISKSDINLRIKDFTIKESYGTEKDSNLHIPSVKTIDDGDISRETDSIIMEDEWTEYHKVPIERPIIGIESDLKQGSNYHQNINPVAVPDEDNISHKSSSVIMTEEWVEYHDPIDLLYTYGTENKLESRNYGDVDQNDYLQNEGYHEFLSSNSNYMTDERMEFLKVPITSLLPTAVLENYDNSEIESAEPLDISNHYTYSYENQSKTEKLRDLTDYSKRNSSTKERYDRNFLSKHQKPILFSTDCLKQTFHVDHEDEELLSKPMMFDAQGNMLENLSETDNFKSITENVTVQIYESKALVKIEITVEMFHNFRTDEAWKRKNVTLTRMIELDLLKIQDSHSLKDIMERNHLNEAPLSWTDEDGNTVFQYKTDNELKGKDLYLLFSNLMAVTHEEEERFKSEIPNTDDFYLTSGPEGQITSVSCEPQYLMAGFNQHENAYLLY